MITNIEEARKLLVEHRANHGPIVKSFEMSSETLRIIERMMGGYFRPGNDIASSLWGIKIAFNEKLPLNEIKPIYE